MLRLTSICCLVFLAVITVSKAQRIDYKGFSQWSWGKKDSTEFYIYSPSNTKASEKYPVVLFLHGCCGDDYHATLRNAVDPPVRMWHTFGANTQRIPTYIIAPKTKAGWQQHIDNIKAVIDSLIDKSNGDPQRIYISGFSMGAQGTWEFIERYPDYFAAAIPMGMDFAGKDPAKFKDIPIWTIRGEEDWWARNLGKQMAVIRNLNGGPSDSSDYVTGINPRMTTFEGMGHGVMWPAVTKLDLLDWTYGKVNDGNKYPTVFFKSPSFKKQFKEGETIELDIEARDSDGSIAKIELSVNGKPLSILHSRPYKTSLKALKGDMEIIAKAFDNQDKYSIATTSVKVNMPVEISTKGLSFHAGDLVDHRILAKGNGALKYSLSKNSALPEGLTLTAAGFIKGVPTREESRSINFHVEDEDGDVVEVAIKIEILKKKTEEVILTDVKNYAGRPLSLSKVRNGEMPFNGNNDEITFSGGISDYQNLTLIQTDPFDSVNAEPFYLKFETDENVTVYVAYEKLDNLYTLTIPEWLKGYRKEQKGQIVAQYFYFDVYAKDFPKGTVSIADAREQENGVNKNYFIMVRKK